jgi:hypothetical protein
MSSLKDKKSARTNLKKATDLQAVAITPPEVVIGRIAGVSIGGAPVVDFPGNPAGQPVIALATSRYDLVSIGEAVALMFLAGDRAKPLAIGLVAQPNGVELGDPAPTAPNQGEPPERLILTATREIIMQCGRASIVLTGAGKVLIRGAHLSLRSSGMHRIIGASVQIN